MNNLAATRLTKTRLIDLSEQHEVNYWAEKLGIRPEVLKGAVRASRSNALDHIVAYLKSSNKIRIDYRLE